MPKVTNAFTTYQAVGNREDLSNAIYNIDPFETPVMSAIRRRNVKNRIFDWQTENLPIVNPNNAQIEGFVLANAPAQPTIRQNNVTQISERDATVSGTQEEAGAVNAAIAPGTVTAGVPVLATDAFAAVAGASQVSVTEAMLGDAMQQAYTNGASPSLWIVPPGPKRTISTFVGRSTTQVLVGKTEVVSTIDVIATDFGRIKVAPSRWVPVDVGLLIDPDYAAVAFFRAFRQFLMARTGDAETRMIVVEWGLEMRNSIAHILFNGIK